MALQKTFPRSYAEQLYRDIDSNIGEYSKEIFPADVSKELYIPGIEHPENLLEQMMSATNDAEAAIALFNAYSSLSPLQASQNAFWIYLAHTELFPYVQKRWPKVKEGGDVKQYVLDHWFFNHGQIRQALSGLWWAVYCSYDENNTNDPFVYSRFLLSNYTLRVVRLGPTKLMRHREGVIGIIKYLMDSNKSSSLSNSLEDRVNFAISYFNKLGATKQLAFLDRNFFYEELKKVHQSLVTYHHKRTAEEETDE